MADEKLSAFSETTPNHGCYCPEKVNIKERREKKEERGKRTMQTSCLFIVPYCQTVCNKLFTMKATVVLV